MSKALCVIDEHIAEHLGVVKDTADCCRERKFLPPQCVGRLWKFQMSAVDEWVCAGGDDAREIGGQEK